MKSWKRSDNPDASDAWWFNLKTGEPEFGLLTPAPYRVGPFATQEEAEKALEKLSERSRSWRAEDEAGD